MATRRFTDPLSMDMSNDLKRVDGVLTQILKDRTTWNEFLRDPNGVLVRSGLHPPTSPEINERVNRIFYATLTNKKLLTLLSKHYQKFRPSKGTAYTDEFLTNLRSGVIQHSIELDYEGLEHLLRSPKVLRQSLRLVLWDLNEKGFLQNRYRRNEINEYVDSVVAAVEARQPIVAHPKLEVWDRNYGIGQPFAALFIEAGLVVTVPAAVEVLAAITVDVITDVNIPTSGPPRALVIALKATAVEGKEDSLRAIAILGRLMDFTGEVLLHAHNFEQRFGS